MTPRYLIVMPLLMLTACGGTMSKNVSQAQVDKDTAACNYEVHKASVSANTADFMSAIRENQLFEDCLASKGYKKTK